MSQKRVERIGLSASIYLSNFLLSMSADCWLVTSAPSSCLSNINQSLSGFLSGQFHGVNFITWREYT